MADMRVPIPVTRDNHGRDTADYTRLEWFAKIIEETHEAMNADNKHLPEELTDIITVCVSFLNALGYNELERAELQRDVNAKNYGRGYWRLKDHED